MINVLSVDWDYFFPDSWVFDWGHKETVFMTEQIWAFRVFSRSMVTGTRAIDVFRPRKRALASFWQQVCPTPPMSLCITESHRDAHTYLTWIRSQLKANIQVFNFDAHHDIHYGNKEVLECGNWVSKCVEEGLIEKYTLIYPGWRFRNPENFSGDFAYKTHFRIPGSLPHFFPFVFICRSSAWTPPWYDHKWLDFIGHWKQDKRLWEKNLISLPSVLEARKPSLEYAIKATEIEGSEIDRINFLCKGGE